MNPVSWCDVESIRWLEEGDAFTGHVDRTGFGVRRAKERGVLITMRGGCECVFVPTRMLHEAAIVQGYARIFDKPSPVVGEGKKKQQKR